MKKVLATSVRKVAEFLVKEVTDEKIGELLDHLCFKKIKHNLAVYYENATMKEIYSGDGHFMREEVGDWKNHFTTKMNERMDEATEKHFRPIGFEFQYE